MDSSGNSVNCAVTVLIKDDTPPMIISCPYNKTVNTAAGVAIAEVDFSALSVTDNGFSVGALINPVNATAPTLRLSTISALHSCPDFMCYIPETTYRVFNLAAGDYNVSLVATDFSGNMATYNLSLYIKSIPALSSTTIASSLLILAVAGSAGIILAAVIAGLLIKRRRTMREYGFLDGLGVLEDFKLVGQGAAPAKMSMRQSMTMQTFFSNSATQGDNYLSWVDGQDSSGNYLQNTDVTQRGSNEDDGAFTSNSQYLNVADQEDTAGMDELDADAVRAFIDEDASLPPMISPRSSGRSRQSASVRSSSSLQSPGRSASVRSSSSLQSPGWADKSPGSAASIEETFDHYQVIDRLHRASAMDNASRPVVGKAVKSAGKVKKVKVTNANALNTANSAMMTETNFGCIDSGEVYDEVISNPPRASSAGAVPVAMAIANVIQNPLYVATTESSLNHAPNFRVSNPIYDGTGSYICCTMR